MFTIGAIVAFVVLCLFVGEVCFVSIASEHLIVERSLAGRLVAGCCPSPLWQCARAQAAGIRRSTYGPRNNVRRPAIAGIHSNSDLTSRDGVGLSESIFFS